ncbi:MAG: kelch repeat-containing protein [Spirochaetota bacterium]
MNNKLIIIFLNIIRFLKQAGIIFFCIIIPAFTSCDDNFDDSIKKENNLTDNSQPVVSFAVSSGYTTNENETDHQVNIILSKTSDKAISVTVSDLLNGSATALTDYNYTEWSSPEIITFNPGETIKTISITPVQDSDTEGTGETINLALSSPVNAALGLSSHQITIYDDESVPVVSFETSTSSTSNENTIAHNINVVLSKASASDVTVTVTDLMNGSATTGDYNYTGWSSGQVITFTARQTVKTIIITPVQDFLSEGTGETINLALSSPVNAALGGSFHVMTITDDDTSWIKLGETATSRAGAAAALSGNCLYIYGGESYSGALNDFWEYDLSTGEYDSLTSNGARAYATLVELNGNLYRFGGTDGSTYYDKQNEGMYYYITESDTWISFDNNETTGSWPAERSHHIAVPVYNPIGPVESIYFQGGRDTGGNLNARTYLINLSLLDWDQFDSTLSHTRSEHSAVYYNNSIYFFGGYNSGTYYNDLWRFNLNGTFSEVITTGITIIPTRSGISIIEHNGNLYVFGGQNGKECFNDLWKYSLSSNTWTKISTAPFKRSFYSAVKYNNSLIIFGGYSLNDLSQKVYSSEVWQYNLE